MELTINISKRKKSVFEFPVIGGILKAIVAIIMIIVAILAVITVMPYHFVKYKVLGFKREKAEKAEPPILVRTAKTELQLEQIEDPNEKHQIALDFLYSVVEYGDESAVFLVNNKGQKTELDGKYLTLFKHKLNEDIWLQEIKADTENKPTSDLIKFNTLDGTVEFIAEIGQFELDKYDEEKNEITGHNLSEDIIVKLNKASA